MLMSRLILQTAQLGLKLILLTKRLPRFLYLTFKAERAYFWLEQHLRLTACSPVLTRPN